MSAGASGRAAKNGSASVRLSTHWHYRECLSCSWAKDCLTCLRSLFGGRKARKDGVKGFNNCLRREGQSEYLADFGTAVHLGAAKQYLTQSSEPFLPKRCTKTICAPPPYDDVDGEWACNI